MKRFYQIISLIFALALFGLPFLVACGKDEVATTPVLPAEFGAPLTAPEEPKAPDVPAVEPPKVPNVPEEPNAPEEPNSPNVPAVETPNVHVPEEPNAPEPTKKAQYVRVLTNGLNVRTGAGIQFNSLGQVEKGVLLNLKGKAENWYETTFRGQKAYVSASENHTALMELDLSREKIENVITEGLRYMGVPYVYGATRYHDGRGNLLKGFTTSKFDCSSLMQYIFYMGAGVKLDVTTRTQIKQGKAVAKSDIRRGDLLFFTNASRYNNTGIERVGHVALYLGDNYILHTASDYAKVELISPQRWNYFLEARRVL